jgi:hypothetical protein
MALAAQLSCNIALYDGPEPPEMSDGFHHTIPVINSFIFFNMLQTKNRFDNI